MWNLYQCFIASVLLGYSQTLYDSPVTDDHLNIIAKKLGTKWKEIGLHLRFSDQEIQEFELREPHNYFLRLLSVLNQWKRRETEPVVGVLVAACTQAGVEGEAKRLLKYKGDDRS
jgi:hypothetical protein